MLRAVIIASILMIWTTSAPATAETGPTGVRILVEEMPGDKANSDCGITEDAVYGAAVSALRYNRVRVVTDTSESLVLYVNVNPRSNGSACGVNMRVALTRFQFVTVQGVGDVMARVEFCENGMLGLGPARQVAGYTDKLKEMVDTCLSRAPAELLAAVTS